MHSVLETSIFTRRADALLSREERAELISELARNPFFGDLVPGLGGIRKMRFAAGAKEARGSSGNLVRGNRRYADPRTSDLWEERAGQPHPGPAESDVGCSRAAEGWQAP